MMTSPTPCRTIDDELSEAEMWELDRIGLFDFIDCARAPGPCECVVVPIAVVENLGGG